MLGRSDRSEHAELPDTPFVARETELRQLHEALDHTLDGRGQVRFVTGEAGAGKSTLTEEFARRAQEKYGDLLVAVGDCNAQTGLGDPYLPFREILGQLTGDVENKLTQGAITNENAGRLRSFLEFSGRALVDLGPDLIDIFVPGGGLVTRAGQLVAGESGWRARLDRLRRDRERRSESDLTARASRQGSEQNQIFEQFTKVIVTLAEEKPIILMVDDLHWADDSSIGLLFHLARRVGNSRVLLLGTYRPEDVALGRGGQRHPLESVVNEIKRQHGSIFLGLSHEDEAGGRAFIDALLDAQPNRLGESFRQKLLRHTRGHALFTAELLNGMRARGDLVTNDSGELEAGPSLDWDTLPARVEGVIEERVKRMPEELQELAATASVEGEVFAAQVLASLKGIDEREALETLDGQLDRRYHLIHEDSLERIGSHRLSRYRFRHNLIQRYLYSAISASRRELLHEDIVRVLEKLYDGRTGEIAGQLALHCRLANLPEQAADHYLVAGRRAMHMFAAEEASILLQKGIDLLRELPDSEENDARRIQLLLALGRARWKLGETPESMTLFETAAALARRRGAGDQLAEAALGYDDVRYRFGFPVEPAVELYEEALETLYQGDSMLRVRVVSGLIRAQGHQMLPIVLNTLVEQAIAMARRLDDPEALCTALAAKAVAYPQPEMLGERLAMREEMLDSAGRIGDQAPLLDAYVLRMEDLLAAGDIESVDRDLKIMRRMVEELGEPFYDYCEVTKLAMRSLLAGRFEDAERYAQRGMQYSQQIDLDNAEGVFGMQMFSIRRLQGRLRALAPLISQMVADHSESASWRPGLALVYAEIDDADSARAEFERLAKDDFAGIPRDALWSTCLSYVADVCVYLQEERRAAVLYRLLEPYAEQAIVVGNSITCNGAASRSLAQLATLMEDWERAEASFRHAIAFNERLQALPWLAFTHLQYAAMLLRRGRPDDSTAAREHLQRAMELGAQLGMEGVERESATLQAGLTD
jgi:tetratricopeptide (TPR) repeat protein/adenylate kinase